MGLVNVFFQIYFVMEEKIVKMEVMKYTASVFLHCFFDLISFIVLL